MSFRLCCCGICLRSSLLVSVFSLVVLMFLLFLGAWQLERASEKEQIEHRFASRLAESAEFVYDPNSIGIEDEFSRVRFSGQFMPSPQVRWENQFRDGQLGFDHLVFFHVKNSAAVLLVDKGWLVRDSQLPDIPSTQTVEGYIYFPKPGFELGQVDLQPGQTEYRTPYLNLEYLQVLVNQPLQPFILRVQQEGQSIYRQDWPVISMPPAKHLAYAVQWFAMAFVVLFLFFRFGCRYESQR